MQELQFFFLNSHVKPKDFAAFTGLDYTTLMKIKGGARASERYRTEILAGIDRLSQ